MEDDAVDKDKAGRLSNWWVFCIRDGDSMYSGSSPTTAEDYRRFLEAVDRGEPDALKKQTRYTRWILTK